MKINLKHNFSQKNFLRITALTFLLTLFSLINAQNQTQKVSIKLQNATLKEFIKQIESKTSFTVVYRDVLIDDKNDISISAVESSLEEVIKEVFTKKGLQAVFNNKTIVITKKKVDSQPQVIEKPKKISGIVLDEKGVPVIGASVMIPGTKIIAVTDINGQFSLEAPSNAKLRISYIGYEPKVEEIRATSDVRVSLEQTPKKLEEVVVVGYGSQKKQSVVGAIVQTKGSDLERTGVTTSVAQALTGLLPGVSTQNVTGMPGADEIRIKIRGASSWNGTDPLVLIDGVERNLSDIDMGQIESVSVLKDASATAVFGVKGAEGVILVTTKRGKEGKAQISFSSSTDLKFASKIPNKMDSYDNYNYQNEALERQNPADPSSWSWYTPQGILKKYRFPANILESEQYPNVDWGKEVLKSYAMTQRYELSISGGTNFAKYFTVFSYLKDDDLLNSGIDVGLPYKPQFGFKRYNFRSNLDFNLSKSTVLSINLAGASSEKSGYQLSEFWGAFYGLSPSSFPVRFSDGAFGYNPLQPGQVNPVAALAGKGSGQVTNYTNQLFSDFKLKQNLDVITKGLSAEISLSYDNRLYSSKSINSVSLLSESIDRNGLVTFSPVSGANQFDFYKGVGTINPDAFSTGSTVRRLHYQGQINYSRSFGKHNLSALALMSRDESTSGSEFPHYREDWVGRLTYAYDDRYFLEANGAYNGSEKFAAKYRFGFFPSVGLGWMLSNESFIKQPWLDKLKIRYSIGTVGSDNFASERWAYNTQWGIDPNDVTTFGQNYSTTNVNTGVGATYKQYLEAVIGNPDLHWEVSQKQNLGIEWSVLNGLISGAIDVFRDDRSDIFMTASQRSNNIYAIFGGAPVAANVGKVQNNGVEVEVKLQKTWSGLHAWLNYSFTYNRNKIIFNEEPLLKPSYQKTVGLPISQPSSYLYQPGFNTSWDDLYGSIPYESRNSGRLPGDKAMIDFNGDGVINSFDMAHYGYGGSPQNTYNITSGLDYKGFSLMVQFYGVFNSNIPYSSQIKFNPDAQTPAGNSLVNNYWTPNNPTGLYELARIGGSGYNTQPGEIYILDASYLRLKNIEIAYTFKGNWLKKINLNTLKTSLSGNNLFFWSKLPEDKESSVNIFSNITNDLYPTVKVVNFRINVTF